jgi:hypothetical protein
MKPCLSWRLAVALNALFCGDQLRLKVAGIALNEPLRDRIVRRLVVAEAAMIAEDEEGLKLKVAGDALVRNKLMVDFPINMFVYMPESYRGRLCEQDRIAIEERVYMGMCRALSEENGEVVVHVP